MKTANSFILLLLFVLCSCSKSAYYLPEPTAIHTSPFGAEIKMKQIDGKVHQGELIAINDSIIVLLEQSMVSYSYSTYSVPIKNMKSFTLQYAKSPHYGWTIPVYSLASLATGVFAIFTLPFNLIVTISVTAGGANAYRYNDQNISLDYIKMFARFPQGIPPNIQLSSITRAPLHAMDK